MSIGYDSVEIKKLHGMMATLRAELKASQERARIFAIAAEKKQKALQIILASNPACKCDFREIDGCTVCVLHVAENAFLWDAAPEKEVAAKVMEGL